MTPGKRLLVSLGLGVLLLTGCSSSSRSKNPSELVAASQDLTVDASGLTTVLTFIRPPGTLSPANFEADGGQIATGAVAAGNTVAVTWDARVTPSHQVRVVGTNRIAPDFVPVTSTDTSAPTFTVSAGMQTVGLGGDTFTIDFSGVRVAPETAEDITSWDLTIDGTSLDLAGSTFTFDVPTQSVAVVLGTQANLHATFELEGVGVTSVSDVPVDGPVLGTASGDAIPPSLVSVVQNLTEDEYGFVVDFTFDEAMDPALNPLAGFDAGGSTLATGYELPSDEVLRVRFNEPVIPGQDSIDLIGIVDAHGNPLGNLFGLAVVAGSTVANAFANATPEVSAVENVGGDTLVVEFVQALDPDVADLAATWDFESPSGNDVDLSTSNLDYDFLAKTLTVTLASDLTTGDSWSFGPATLVVDVDGETFVGTASGNVAGDAAGPLILDVVQNRVLDGDGRTYEITLSEDVDAVQAETTTNYVFSSGATVTSAMLLVDGNTVRLVLDADTYPGQHTVDVGNLADVAGNPMAAATGLALGSTDGLQPLPIAIDVFAEAGLDNDTITVVFDDDMIEPEVVDPDNWIFQSPVGSFLDTSTATVTWSAGARQAVLTFDGGDGINLVGGDDFSLAFVSMRDFGGNTVAAAATTGTVDAETGFPSIDSAWVESGNATRVHVRFDEPVELWNDPLTSYTLRDASGFDVGGGPPTIVEDADGLGATLTWGVGAVVGTHTIDVRGLADPAGNTMFPALLVPIVAEISSEPGLAAGVSAYTAVAGENNDELSIAFDQPLSRWNLLDPANFTLTNGSSTAIFENATLAFDGSAVITVGFDRNDTFDFDNGAYTLTVDGILSAQGVAMSVSSMDSANAGVGTDVVAASAVGGRTRLDAADALNSVLIELSEALDFAAALDTNNYAISGVNPDSVALLGPRTVRATWVGGVAQGQTVDISATDRAGNTGLVSEAIQAVDSAGPAVISVAGVVRPDVGGDTVVVTFNQPVGRASATNNTNYTVASGGVPIDVSMSTLVYSSVTNSTTIPLPIDLDESLTVNVMVSGVKNHAGIAMSPAANVNGAISGDATPPSFAEAFANHRADPSGRTLFVRFEEDVDAAFATDPMVYTVTGGQTVVSASLVRPDTVRLLLSSAPAPGDELEVTGMPDVAGNTAGTLTIAPVL